MLVFAVGQWPAGYTADARGQIGYHDGPLAAQLCTEAERLE